MSPDTPSKFTYVPVKRLTPETIGFLRKFGILGSAVQGAADMILNVGGKKQVYNVHAVSTEPRIITVTEHDAYVDETERIREINLRHYGVATK